MNHRIYLPIGTIITLVLAVLIVLLATLLPNIKDSSNIKKKN